MKTLLLFLAVVAVAEVPVDRALYQNIKTYTVNEFKPKAHTLDGQTIKLKFNSRGDLSKAQDGSFSTTITNRTDVKKRGAESYLSWVSATVPADGVEWFTKIPTEYFSKGSYVAFCKVEGERVVFIGRELKTDAKGSRIVW